MSPSLLAFVESSRSLPGALAFARRSGASSITLVSEDYLPERDIQFDGEKRAVLFGDFRPADLDKRVLERTESFLDRLFDANRGMREAFTWNGEDLTRFMTYPFTDIAQHCVRTAVIMKKIEADHQPDLVYADRYWRKFTGLTDMEISNPFGLGSLLAWKFRRIVMLLFWLAVGLFLKLIGPVVLGKLLGFNIPAALQNKEIVLVGNYRQNNRIRHVWDRVKERTPHGAELFSSGRYPLKLLLELASSKSRGLLGCLVRLVEIPHLACRYLKIAVCYLFSHVEAPFDSAGGKYNFHRLLLDRFILLTSPSALIFASAKCRFEGFRRLKSVLFSVPAAWCTILSSLGEKNIKTIASTHGMSLSPLGYRSNFSYKMTHSSFDSSVLSAYSDDVNYLSLSMTPRKPAAKKAQNISDHLRAHLIPIGASRPESNESFPIAEGPNAAILTSSNIKRGFMFKFLEDGIEHFAAQRDKYGIDYVAVKLHPDSDLDIFRADLEAIVGNTIDLPVYVTKTVDIKALLARSAFAASMPSSIMLDLLLLDVPFSLFTKCTMVDRSLITRFAGWMRFKTFEELDSIGTEDLREFPRIAAELRNLYWNHGGESGKSYDEMADFIVKSK